VKPWLRYALVALTFALAGFGYGRFLQPPKTVSIENTEEIARLRQQLQAAVAENTELKKHTVKEVETVIVYRDGKPATKTMKSKTDTHVDKTTNTKTDVKINTDATNAKLTSKSLTVDPSRPDWNVSVLGGVTMPNFTRPTELAFFTAGIHVQRRIVGPFNAGVWVIGSTGGMLSAGASLGVQF
jgi:hypothetical protein